MAVTNEADYLSDAMRACVNVCAEYGFSFPVLMMMAGSTGAMLAARFLEHEDGQIRSQMLADDADERTLGWPVNVIVVDACGKSVRLRMGSSNTRADSTLN
jgi:hypothetical protein